MPLDGSVIHALKKELAAALTGGRVDKVFQPERDEIQLLIRAGGENYRLLFSANPNHPRVHITSAQKENPLKAPMFCMLLRKHLGGAKLLSVSQPDFERALFFDFEAYNELGDKTVKRLVIEMMGRHSNVIFCEEDGRIIECLKHVTPETSTVRLVLPGLSYEAPPSQGKRNPLSVNEGDILEMLSEIPEGQKLDKWVLSSFTGISPLLAREAVFAFFGETEVFAGELTDKEGFKKALCRFFQALDAPPAPTMLQNIGEKKAMDFAICPISQYGRVEKEAFPSVSALLDAFYTARDHKDHLLARTHDTRKLVQNLIQRAQKKMLIQEDTIDNAKKRDQYKLYGDLITANLYRISDGQERVTVENLFSEGMEPVEIPLDPTLSAAKNAQHYYRAYTKAKTAEQMASEQLARALMELQYLESVEEALEHADTLSALQEIREELHEEGYLHHLQKGKKQRPALSEPLHFKSSDGFDIDVGRNNKQNDRLTLKSAAPYDLWFHTKTIAGSHTILRTERCEDIPETTLYEAAMLAAYFSKGQHSANVPVDYTRVRYVKKPSGAKPGLVIYTDNKTLYVTPDEALAEKLRKK